MPLRSDDFRSPARFFSAKKRLSILVFLILAIFLYSGTVFASDTWTGASGTGEWGSTGNWQGGTIPGSGDTAIFNGNGNGQTVLDLGVGVTISQLVFETSSAMSYTIGGVGIGAQTLIIDSGGRIAVNAAVDHSQTIDANINPVAACAFTNNGNSTLTLNGAVAGSGSGLVLAGSSVNNNTIAGAISYGGDLVKNDAGLWILSGSNSYGGSTTVNAGTLQFAKAGALSNYSVGGAVIVNNTGTLTLSVSGSGWTDGEVSTLLGAATFNAGSYLGIDTSVGDFAYGNAIGGNLGLKKSGLNTLTLSGANTYAGGTTVSAGALSIASTGALPGWDTNGRYSVADGATLAVYNAVNDGNIATMLGTTNFAAGSAIGFDTTSGDRAYSVAITDTLQGALGLTKLGSNTLTLDTANTYTGTTTVSAGTLAYGVDNIISSGPVTVSGGTLDVGTFSDSVGMVTLSNNGNIAGTGGVLTSTDSFQMYGGTASAVLGGAAPLYQQSGTTTLSGMNTYTGVTYFNGGTLSVSTINSGGVAGNLGAATNAAGNLYFNGGTLMYTGTDSSTDRNFTIANGVTGTFEVTDNNLTLSGASAATSGQLIKTGDGTLTLSGNNLHTGGTTVIAGTLAYGADNVLREFVFVDGGTLALGSFSDSVSLVRLSNNGSITGSGGVLTSTSQYQMYGGTASAILAGAVPLYQLSGTTTLSGVNTYTGVTYFSDGTLSVSSINNGGVAGNLGAASTAAGNLYFSGGTLQYTGADASTDRNFTISNGTTGTIEISANNLTISGAAAATTGSLTKTGNGTLTLSGANQYTGTTTISAGTLAYGADNVIKTGAVNVNGGTLALGGYSDSVGTVTLSNNGSITGTGGVLTSTGGFSMNGGTASAILAGAVPLSQYSRTTTLSGMNTYTGATHINGGTLSVSTVANGGVASNLGASSNAAGNLVFNGGALQYTGTDASTDRNFTIDNGDAGTIEVTANNLTISGASTATSGQLIKTGAGTLTLSGANQYTGATTISAGTLAYGADNVIKTGAVTVNGGTLALGGYSDSVGTVTLSNNGSIIGTGGVLTSTNGFQIYGGTASVVLGGAVPLVLWSGTTTLSGMNTYTGVTTLSGGGTLSVSTINNGGVAGNLGAATSAAGNLRFSGGTLQYTGADASTDRNFTINNGNTGTFEVTDNNLTLSGASAATSGQLIKTGAGTLTLSGTNLHTGATTITEGTLSVGANANLGNANSLVFDGGTLQVTGVALNDFGTHTPSFTATKTVGLDINNAANTFTVSQQLNQTTGGLTKSGAGTLLLTGANDYSGATTISAGVLQIGAGGTAGTLGTGDVTNNASLVFNRSDALTAANAISGIGTLTKNGGGALTLSGPLTYTGTTTVNAGTLNLNQDLASVLNFTGAAAVNLAAGRNFLDDVTTGAEDQGTLAFLGSSTTGGTIGANGAALNAVTLAGTLTMGHNIAATTVTVNTGGDLSLSGTRSLWGDLTLAGSGAVSLGTHTLHLLDGATGGTGNYSQGAGQTLSLTVQDGSTFGRILAAGSAAGINGGTVAVTVGPNYIPAGATFTVIDNGSGAITGLPAVTSNSYVLGFTPSDAGGDLVLTANRTNGYDSPSISSDPNIQAVGEALEQAGAEGATGDMLTVLNTLDSLGSGEAIADALETMTPDISGGATEGSRALAGQGLTIIGNRLGGLRRGFSGTGVSSGETLSGLGVWMQGLGSHLKQGARSGIEGYSANLFGTTIGVDKLIDRHFRAGFAGSYGWAETRSKQPGSSSDHINSWQGTLYGSFDSLDLRKAREHGKNSRGAVRNQGEDFWYVDGMAAFTQNNYDSRREIWLGALKRIAKADHHGQQYSGKLETGYTFTFRDAKSLEVTPLASLGYNYLRMNGYKEEGAGALNLNVDGEGFHQMEQGLGMKFAYPLAVKKAGTFIPSVKALWLYDYISDRFDTTASFVGGGPAFDSNGAEPAKNGALFGSEIAFLSKENMTLTANYDCELRDEYQNHTYYATARYDF